MDSDTPNAVAGFVAQPASSTALKKPLWLFIMYALLRILIALAEHQQQATKAQIMDRRREDVRDSFLDMVDAENEAAIQTLETPLEVSFPIRTAHTFLRTKKCLGLV